MIAKLGMEFSVEIIGTVKNRDLYKYYQTHEVFLNTTSYESFRVAVARLLLAVFPLYQQQLVNCPNSTNTTRIFYW